MNESLRTLCARIGYQFADESLVETAMRHRSYVAENDGVESNERLEFLGDAILGWVVADLVYRAHADLHEVAGSVAYFERKFDVAEASLRRAERLGAPSWRVAYHLGLIREAQERRDEAIALYTKALEGRPDWAPARDRLAALKASH